jgi:hypothetical protein
MKYKYENQYNIGCERPKMKSGSVMSLEFSRGSLIVTFFGIQIFNDI